MSYNQNCKLSFIRFADFYIIIARRADDVRIHTQQTTLPKKFYCDAQLNDIVKLAQATARWGDCTEIAKLGDAPYCYLAYAPDNAYLIGAVDMSDYEEITDDHYIYVINEDWEFLGDLEYYDIKEASEFINGERSKQECATLYYLVEYLNESFSGAMSKLDDYTCVNDSLEDCAEALFDEAYAGDIPERLRSYIDYEAFARDCQLGGDMFEFGYSNSIWTCTNANQ